MSGVEEEEASGDSGDTDDDAAAAPALQTVLTADFGGAQGGRSAMEFSGATRMVRISNI